MTVYLINTEEVSNHVVRGHDTLVFSSIDAAKAKFNELVSDITMRDKYKDWERAEDLGIFETWPKGLENKFHLSLYLTENAVN